MPKVEMGLSIGLVPLACEVVDWDGATSLQGYHCHFHVGLSMPLLCKVFDKASATSLRDFPIKLVSLHYGVAGWASTTSL